jgi:hypothetical protein
MIGGPMSEERFGSTFGDRSRIHKKHHPVILVDSRLSFGKRVFSNTTVMEFADGGSLHKILFQKQSERQILEIIVPLLEG